MTSALRRNKVFHIHPRVVTAYANPYITSVLGKNKADFGYTEVSPHEINTKNSLLGRELNQRTIFFKSTINNDFTGIYLRGQDFSFFCVVPGAPVFVKRILAFMVRPAVDLIDSSLLAGNGITS